MSGGIIQLPWPPAKLSPNARLHWRALHKVKLAYKAQCISVLLDQPAPDMPPGRIPLTITFYPPDKRKRDRDNLQSSLKYGLDCLARHLGVDDYLFDPSYRFAEPTKPARVTVEVGQ